MSRLTRRVALKPKSAPSSGGQQLFTGGGTFVVPAGFFTICAVAIGRGGDFFDDSIEGGGGGSGYYVGGGGGLAYSNAIAVTPGETLNVEISAAPGALIVLRRAGTKLLLAKSASYTNAPAYGFVGDVARYGGQGPLSGAPNTNGSGASAAGYTADGQGFLPSGSKGGGGTPATGGGPASAAGSSADVNGQNYGGGAAYGGTPGAPCVRILWGPGRAFPNTNTGDV